MNSERLQFLLSAYLDGVLAPEEQSELEHALRGSAAARTQFWEQTRLHNQLRAVVGEGGEPRMETVMSDNARVVPLQQSPQTRWLRHPLRALAAAIALSVLCTSAVWAYAGQLLGQRARFVSLLHAGFEGLGAVPPFGVPDRPGQWSGDYSDLVGAENGVQPRSGKSMLRFLRADNALGQAGPRNYVAEAIHVVDLRPYGSDLRAGTAQIELAAWFASAQSVDGIKVRFLLKAATFSGTPEDAPALWDDASQASLSMVQHQMDPSPVEGEWKSLAVSIPVPPQAQFLVFECAVMQVSPKLPEGTAVFPAQYVDDVTVRLRQGMPPASLPAFSGSR
jgi:hypothetical protein